MCALQEERWPKPFGMLDGYTVVRGTSALLQEFLAALDRQIRISQMKLRDFLERFDLDGNAVRQRGRV